MARTEGSISGPQRHLMQCRRRDEPAAVLVVRIAASREGLKAVLRTFRVTDSVGVLRIRHVFEIHAVLDANGLVREWIEARICEALAGASPVFGWSAFPDEGQTLDVLLERARASIPKATDVVSAEARGPRLSRKRPPSVRRPDSGDSEARPHGQLEGRDGRRPGSRVLVTGCAGFLGSHLSERLVSGGHDVLGIDCFTDYYPRVVKERNLEQLRDERRFSFRELDLSSDDLSGLLEGVDTVFHLAAQPGVRLSFGDGFGAYLRNNVHATQRLLEEGARWSLGAFTYASSSSVYGNAASYPTAEQAERRPVSPYGMTKVATEELAAVYHRSYGVPVVGIRYFTAYGPRQRPDMAFSRFLTQAIAGEPLTVLGDGKQVREFTFVEDVVTATVAAAERGQPGAVYNVGGGSPVELQEALAVIEELIGRPLPVDRRPAQIGEARTTACDGSLAERELGFLPVTELREGIAAQLDWLLSQREAVTCADKPMELSRR